MTIAQFKLSDDPLLEHQQEDRSLEFSPTQFASDMQANSASPGATPQQDATVEEITSMDTGDITTEHQHTQLSQTTIPSALYNASQDLAHSMELHGYKDFSWTFAAEQTALFLQQSGRWGFQLSPLTFYWIAAWICYMINSTNNY